MSLNGYEINMRRTHTGGAKGEDLAVIPSTYDSHNGRYYMAYTLADGWVELTPEYVTKHTRTVTDFDPALKRAVDSNMGYILNTYPRVVG